jgi:hypothetical protein
MDETLKVVFKHYLENPPSTKEELNYWIITFLDLALPDNFLPEEGSNSSPMDALWESYSNYKSNSGGDMPGYVWLSSRDAGKTLSASILAVVMMVFFNATICWLASIEPQSKIALSNVQSFIQKIKPFLLDAGREIESSNSRNLEIVSKDGSKSNINILVATMSSVNGKHVNLVFVDELDLLRDPRVIQEVQAVASLIEGQFPLKLFFSTRKFAFGNMEKIINNREAMGLKLLKWDILDVTERCPDSRHRPDLPEVELYVPKDPPLESYTEEQYKDLLPQKQNKLDKIRVPGGCQGCKLVSQCRGRLAKRPENSAGMLWKKIDHTINMFKSMSPDMANAQLLCRRPSQSGLVYPRFDETQNTLSVQEAYENWSGSKDLVDINSLVKALRQNGIEFYVGGDWGSTAAQAFVVSCVMPGGDWWIVDAYAIPNLEFDEVKQLGLKIKAMYEPRLWFMDTNQPMFIKAFNKAGMLCKAFKKDVMGGIESVRTMIVDSSGRRCLKVIKHERTEIVLEMFRKHHFMLDSQGNPTDNPDDGEAWSDIGDSTRYLGQNLFGNKTIKPMLKTSNDPLSPNFKPRDSSSVNSYNNSLMKEEIQKLTKDDPTPKVKKKGSFKWSL